MGKSKKQLTSAQKSSNAVNKPRRTEENRKRRALKHLRKHPNDKVAQMVLKEGHGPEQHHVPKQTHEPKLFYPMKHPDDQNAGDYFRTPVQLTWPKKVVEGTAATMSELFKERNQSDPFIGLIIFHRIVQGLGHVDDYTFKPGSMVRHA